MGLQKYRADFCRVDVDEVMGIVTKAWYAHWMGGPTLAKIENCRTPFGPRMVYVRGEPDTWFSYPASCKFRGKYIWGWLGRTEGKWEFHPYNDSYWFPYVDRE